MKNNFKDDQDILEALRSRIPEQVNAALKNLLQSEKLRGFVRQQIMAQGGSEENVKECLHQALIVFFNNVQGQTYDPSRSRISTYIVKIAAQLFFTQRRSQGRRTAMHDRSVQTGEGEPTVNPEEAFNLQHRKTLLAQLMSKLDDKCQQLMKWYSMHYSMAEIAEKAPYKSADVAKMAVKDCRKKIQQILLQQPDLMAELRAL